MVSDGYRSHNHRAGCFRGARNIVTGNGVRMRKLTLVTLYSKRNLPLLWHCFQVNRNEESIRKAARHALQGKVWARHIPDNFGPQVDLENCDDD